MGHLNMSKKERTQMGVFEKLKDGEISQAEAAYRLNVSERWVRKKYKRFLEHGEAGLLHKNRGKESPRRWSESEKQLTIDLLKTVWVKAGPTMTVYYLKKHHKISVSKETVRKTMIEERIAYKERKKGKRKHHKRRERRPMFGLFIQVDGSPHDWFEGRGPKCTLLVFIDDATSKILWLALQKVSQPQM